MLLQVYVPFYIQLYRGNASLLAERLEVIQQTASVILALLEPPMPHEAEAITPANSDEAQRQEAA